MEQEKDKEKLQPKEEVKKEEKAPLKKEAKEAPKEEKKTEQKAPVKKEEAPKGKIRSVNCLSCNKLLKKRKWYYRDGKYYCNKRCWRAYKAKSASKKEQK